MHFLCRDSVHPCFPPSKEGLDLFCCCHCSVFKLCPTLCDSVDSSTPGIPVLHYFPGCAKPRVLWVGDATQPSHPLSPLVLLPSIFPSIIIFFKKSTLHIRWPKYWSFSNSPSNIQDWFPLGLSGLILLYKGLPRVFSSTTVWKHQFLGSQLSLGYKSPIHSFRYRDFCWISLGPCVNPVFLALFEFGWVSLD